MFNVTVTHWILPLAPWKSLLHYLSPLCLFSTIFCSRQSIEEQDGDTSIEKTAAIRKISADISLEIKPFAQPEAILGRHQISNDKILAGKMSRLVEALRTTHGFVQRWSASVGLLLKRLTWRTAPTCLSTKTTPHPNQQNIICVGIFSTVHRLDDMVRKVPSPSDTGDFPSNCEAIRNEAQIYRLLGRHPRIAECLSADETDNHIDLYYYQNGTLFDYIKMRGENISSRKQWRWGQQIIEAVVLLHSHEIIHSDLALRQYLVDDQLDARLSDFGASAFPGHAALGLENASHCLPRDFDQPNTVESDLFALGSTLYELGAGMAPYYDLSDDEITSQYAREVFPDVSGIFCGEIILQCWKRNFVSAGQVLSSYNTIYQTEF